jgi:citrate lyase subunit beta/citryl-CoA lyase
MAIMRSVFYVPANNQRFIDKAPELPCDIVTFDIEDAVPPSQKETARKMTVDNLQKLAGGKAEVYVRINGWHTEYTNDDLEAVVRPGLDGVTLPKTRDLDDIKRLDWKIGEMEIRSGMPEGSVKISVLLETAMGIMNAYEILTGSKRIVSTFFGAVDYCADMRIRLTNKSAEQQVARTIVAIAARAANIVALDAPFADYSNMDAFIENTNDGRQMGFEGRMLIHPSQVEVANRLYSPTDAEVEEARKIVKVFEEEGLAKGLASVSFEGKMVDTPFMSTPRVSFPASRKSKQKGASNLNTIDITAKKK